MDGVVLPLSVRGKSKGRQSSSETSHSSNQASVAKDRT